MAAVGLTVLTQSRPGGRSRFLTQSWKAMFESRTARSHGSARSGDGHRPRRLRSVLAGVLAVAAVASVTIFARETPASASALPSSWKMVFDSNFTGTSVKGKPNPKVWTTCFPWATTAKGCTTYGNSGADLEWYLPSQV